METATEKVLRVRVMELVSKNIKLKQEASQHREIVRQLKGLIEMLEKKE